MPRKPSARRSNKDTQRIVTPRTLGARAAVDWFEGLGLSSEKPWYVEIALDVANRPALATYSADTGTRFHLNVYPEEWGVFFCHDGRVSWIRVTDEAFVHGRDDHRLIDDVPALPRIRRLVHELEKKHRIAFQRDHAFIRTNVAAGKAVVRKWLATV